MLMSLELILEDASHPADDGGTTRGRGVGGTPQMSTARTAWTIDAFPTPPDGGCAFCGKPRPPRNSRYCSAACSDEVAIRTSPSFARYKVRERDAEICATCGRDCAALEAELRRLGIRSAYTYRHGGTPFLMRNAVAIRELLAAAGFRRRHLWEVDHVLSVVEGGGLCGLENLRTLCIPCHLAATRELAARRAEERRGQLAMELGT